MNKIGKWRRIIAVGCSHGDCSNRKIQEEVLAFKRRFDPHYVMELGDIVDTAAMRSGARGTPDEGKDLGEDKVRGIQWLEEYEPTHITYGNHDWRLVELSNSPNAIVSCAAKSLWNAIETTAAKLKAKTKPYDFEHNWFQIGGTYWGHGFWFNEAAVRDTAEYLGGPVVMAHLHAPQQVVGRTRQWSQSFCVGTLADIDKLTYARRRRATARWGAGVVFGEVCEDKAQLWLSSAPKGESLHFPL